MHQALCFCLATSVFVKNKVALIVASSFLSFDSRKCLTLTLQFNTEAVARSKGAKDAEDRSSWLSHLETLISNCKRLNVF